MLNGGGLSEEVPRLRRPGSRLFPGFGKEVAGCGGQSLGGLRAEPAPQS